VSRFSQLYIERGPPTQDSLRMRNRLAAFVVENLEANPASQLAQAIRQSLGLEVHVRWEWFQEFFRTADLRDVLDTVTIVCQMFKQQSHGNSLLRNIPFRWRQHVQRVFSEENLAYRLGDDEVVHPFIDSEFDYNRVAALAALASDRFGEARQGFESAFRHLRNGEDKQAIRMMFPAVETAARVLNPGAMSRLDVNDIDRYFEPQLRAKYGDNRPAIDAGGQMLGAVKKWIVASHIYRHGPEVQDPVEPPRDFVVLHLSAGASFLRWMIELYS